VSAAEWVAISISALTLVVTFGVLRTTKGLRRSVAELHSSVDALSAGAATTDDLRAAVRAVVDGEPDPVDEPEPVVSRVPTVLRTRSVVKAMALGTGTAHAARRLRNGNGKGR
jgi:hypothetical protein